MTVTDHPHCRTCCRHCRTPVGLLSDCRTCQTVGLLSESTVCRTVGPGLRSLMVSALDARYAEVRVQIRTDTRVSGSKADTHQIHNQIHSDTCTPRWRVHVSYDPSSDPASSQPLLWERCTWSSSAIYMPPSVVNLNPTQRKPHSRVALRPHDCGAASEAQILRLIWRNT